VAAEERATLLIVEDDPGVARLQQVRLERAGYNVLVAASAAEALAQVKEAPVDLLLLDQGLPGNTSGLELYQQVKAAGLDVPAILVTALSGDTIVLQSFRAGVYDFVPKTPEYLDYLLPSVERVLQKRRTEFQLAESEARMACIIASAMDAVLTVDEHERITLFNPAAETMFGCRAADALRQPIQKFLPGWAPPKEVSLPATPWETDALRQDGQSIPVELSVSWVQTPRRRFWTCLARDIRERRRAQEHREGLIREQAARKVAEAGQQRMATVARENARLYQELRHSDRLKDEFLAMLAHELRNPLAPIRNALQLIHLAGHDQEADNAESLAIIERQVQHLVRLVDDLLDVSRISQGKILLQKDWLNLADIVARAVESSGPLIQAHGHQLTVSLPPEALAVEGDAVRLVQVLTNLLNNAAKYTPQGGRIDLLVTAANSQDGEPGTAIIRLRDTGMGIRPDMLPRLFEPFTQSERTLARSDGGLGIGLTLVRRLTELHGGSVQAVSEGPGRGSEFIVRLPLARGPAPVALPAAPAPAPAPAARRRVLVVDDNLDSAATLTRLLQALDHEVRVAHDGGEGMQLARDAVPDVILLDIGLPGLDGYEVARRLRGDRHFDRSLLVAVTGYGSPEDRRLSQEAGFNAHLVKPVDLGELKQVLAHAPLHQSKSSSVLRSKG
jgi:PAS domain S-box-containing protein